MTYDSDKEDAIIVYTKPKPVKFKANSDGLYYYEVSEKYIALCNEDKNDTSLVEIVAENRSNFTTQQFERAKIARKLYHNVGAPSIENFKKLIQMNAIKNCPVTINDIKIAEQIFGKDISTIKGKTVRKTPKVIVNDTIEIPKELVMKHHNIEICMDVMFINGQPMLTTIDKTIKFCAVVPIDSRVHSEYFRAIDVVLRHYNKGGFIVRKIHCDIEFKPMSNKVSNNLDIEMNYTNVQDHIPEVEQNI